MWGVEGGAGVRGMRGHGGRGCGVVGSGVGV